MRARASLGWRAVTVVAFGATAALAVTLTRGASTHTALESAKGAGGQRAQTIVTALCVDSGLRISVAPGTRMPPAAIRYPLEFTNVSGAPCTLDGYPQVMAYQGDDLPVGAAAGRDESVVAGRVVLKPGQTAHATLEASVPVARCRPVLADGLRVVAPGQHAAQYLRRPLTTCAGGASRGQDYLRIRALQPGTGLGAGAQGGAAGTVAAGGPKPVCQARRAVTRA